MKPNIELPQDGFPAELISMLRSGTTEGRTGKKFESLGALSSLNNLIVLRNLLMLEKPLNTLEIGLSFGGSALVFAGCHRDLGRDASRQHLVVDPFQDSVWDDAGLLALERADLDGFVDFVKEYSSLALPLQLRKGSRVDFAYIDGSHIFEDVFIDFFYTSRLLTEGGLIAFDDCADPNIAKVLRFIDRNLRDSFSEIDLSPFRRDDGKSLRYQVAKLLGKVQIRAFRKIGKSEREWCSPFTNF